MKKLIIVSLLSISVSGIAIGSSLPIEEPMIYGKISQQTGFPAAEVKETISYYNQHKIIEGHNSEIDFMKKNNIESGANGTVSDLEKRVQDLKKPFSSGTPKNYNAIMKAYFEDELKRLEDYKSQLLTREENNEPSADSSTSSHIASQIESLEKEYKKFN